MAKNKLSDLNDHLFAQLERLGDEALSGEALQEELDRTQAIAAISKQVVSNATLVLKAQRLVDDGQINAKPAMLAIGSRI